MGSKLFTFECTTYVVFFIHVPCPMTTASAGMRTQTWLVLYNLLRTYLHCAEGTTMPTIDTNIK